MVEITPLISSTSIPQIAKIGLALFIAGIILPMVLDGGYTIPEQPVHFFLLVLGEALIGILIGFFIVLIFAAFQLAGQFFSLQMGFGASQVFDPLAQVEIPLIGQFFNIIAMFVFVTMSGFHKFLLTGVFRSFEVLRAIDLVAGRTALFRLFTSSLGQLFGSALTIAFPILGTLFVISVTMGLMAKAAPQMNLLMMGFPVAIGMAFIILFMIMPFLMQTFSRIIDIGFDQLRGLFSDMKGAVP